MKKFLKSSDVNAAQQKEAVDDMVPEDPTVELEDVSSFTGVVEPSIGIMASTPGTISTTGAGGVYPPFASMPSYPATTTSGIFAGGGILYPEPKKKPAPVKMVNLPRKFTEKVLLAFLEEAPKDPTKDVVWAANLPVEYVEMTMKDGKMQLVVTLSLEDVYGNDSDES